MGFERGDGEVVGGEVAAGDRLSEALGFAGEE